jgi:riboflavin biosynthesis pyrimidine reductase
VRQIYPVDGPELEIITPAAPGPLPAAVAELAALYGNGAFGGGGTDRPWIRANMVASADGASALDGLSGGLAGPADRMVFLLLRSLADVILVGARTARAEKYKPARKSRLWADLRAGRPATPPIAVVTSSLDFSDCQALLFDAPEDAQTIVLTTAAAAAAAADAGGTRTGNARVVVAGEQRVDISQAIAALVSLGYRQILTEGGPHLLGQLADAGLVDELCLTTSPVLAGGTASRIVANGGAADRQGHPAGLVLVHVLTDAGHLLSRYVKGTPDAVARQG